MESTIETLMTPQDSIGYRNNHYVPQWYQGTAA